MAKIFSGNHPQFNQRLNDFLSKRPSRAGLPQQILVTALSGYETRNLRWGEVLAKAKNLENLIQGEMPEFVIQKRVCRSVSISRAAVGLSVYHVNALPHGEKDAFFGAYMDAFILKRNKVLLMQCFDPVGVTGHLHRRMMSRTQEGIGSFADFHSKLSNFWPILIEVGRRRRLGGSRANVNHFVMPLGDGLAFGELQKLEGAFLFAPEVLICEKGSVKAERLPDNLSYRDARMLVQIRTVFPRSRLNKPQKELHGLLEDFACQHQDAIASLRRRFLHAGGTQTELGFEFERVFLHDVAGDQEVDRAVAHFEALSMRPEWINEVTRSQQASRSQDALVA